MDACDWCYAGEGGRHAIFSYQPSKMGRGKGSSDWNGCMLRLEKSTLAMSAVLSPGLTSSDDTRSTKELGYSTRFTREVIMKELSPFIDPPTALQLDWQFVYCLRKSALSSGSVSERREKDWSVLDASSASRPAMATAFLMQDYRIMADIPEDGRSLSFEIKPKAGYTPISPLVDPKRRIKYRHSRFALLQQLYCKGYVVKEWMGASPWSSASSYDPLDLFSGEESRIRTALRALAQCPQNNLKIWYRGDNINEAVLGGASSFDWNRFLSVLPSEDGSESLETEENLFEVVTAILSAENLLKAVLRIQQLDILDADGAIQVYQRLVDLFGGSQAEAERFVDETSDEYLRPGEQPPHALLHSSPYRLQGSSSAIVRLCHEIETFVTRLSQANDSFPSDEEMSNSRNRSLLAVNLMTPEECRYLLQTWLLSLAMCDISVFVTFCRVPSDRSSPMHSSQAVTTRRQSHNSPGVVVLQSDDEAESCAFRYEVKVIDYDRKPVKKLRRRLQKEAQFDRL